MKNNYTADLKPKIIPAFYDNKKQYDIMSCNVLYQYIEAKLVKL